MRIILDNDQVIEGERPLDVVVALARRDHLRHDTMESEATLARRYMDATRGRIKEQFGEDLPDHMPMGFLRELHRLGIIKEIIDE